MSGFALAAVARLQEPSRIASAQRSIGTARERRPARRRLRRGPFDASRAAREPAVHSPASRRTPKVALDPDGERVGDELRVVGVGCRSASATRCGQSRRGNRVCGRRGRSGAAQRLADHVLRADHGAEQLAGDLGDLGLLLGEVPWAGEGGRRADALELSARRGTRGPGGPACATSAPCRPR